MRVVLALLLLPLGLCGSGTQREGGGLGEAGEISQFQPLFTPDMWAEVRALREMVVELKVELRNLEARVKDSESQMNEVKAEQIITKVHTEQLQREESVQATELVSLGSRLTATESRTGDLERETADLQSRLRSSESELLVSKSRIDQLQRENAEKPKVAFYAALTDEGNIGSYNTDITLRYSKVFTNTGNGYNPATGLFTAPVRGVYYFQFTVCGDQTGHMGVSVYKNSQRIMFNVEWKEEEGFKHFTNSVVLELTAADEIRLVLPSDFSLYDDANSHSTFSGSLLFPL